MDPGREDELKFAKHFERAQGWLLLENHAAAARALRLIPAGFRGRPEVTQFRAHLHMAAGQWRRAEPLLRQLRKRNPDDPQHGVSLAYAVRRAKSVIWFNLACYAAQQGRFAEACDRLREAGRREDGYRELAKTDSDLTPFWIAVAAGVVAAPW
jgi:predicted Zn-dependent protease